MTKNTFGTAFHPNTEKVIAMVMAGFQPVSSCVQGEWSVGPPDRLRSFI